MNSQLANAFQAGSHIKPDEVNLLLVSMFCAAILLFCAWVLVSAFRGITTHQTSWRQLGSITARTILLILISFWLVIS